ncbi:hypothetical protein H8959_001036 [Pygathrix nigripes]
MTSKLNWALLTLFLEQLPIHGHTKATKRAQALQISNLPDRRLPLKAHPFLDTSHGSTGHSARPRSHYPQSGRFHGTVRRAGLATLRASEPLAGRAAAAEEAAAPPPPNRGALVLPARPAPSNAGRPQRQRPAPARGTLREASAEAPEASEATSGSGDT